MEYREPGVIDMIGVVLKDAGMWDSQSVITWWERGNERGEERGTERGEERGTEKVKAWALTILLLDVKTRSCFLLLPDKRLQHHEVLFVFCVAPGFSHNMDSSRVKVCSVMGRITDFHPCDIHLHMALGSGLWLYLPTVPTIPHRQPLDLTPLSSFNSGFLTSPTLNH